MAKNNSKMNAKQFGIWIEEQTGTAVRMSPGRTACVINIDHIEPGKYAALYVTASSTGLLVLELMESFASELQAWQAIEDMNSLVYPPRTIKEWITEQYLTDKTAQVEKLAI